MMFEVTVTIPKEAPEREGWVHTFVVIADDEETADALVRETHAWMFTGAVGKRAEVAIGETEDVVFMTATRRTRKGR